jgi:hypothetical protein
MRTAAVTAVGAVAAFGALLVPAATASADPSAQEVIDILRSQGYNVVVDRVGSGRLSDCTVTGVRNPKSITRLPIGDERDDLNVNSVTLRQTITVSLDCS